MRELLELWAHMESGRCYFYVNGSHYNESPHFTLWALNEDNESTSIDLLDIECERFEARSLIQAYVQQAIEARGWRLITRSSKAVYFAEIRTTGSLWNDERLAEHESQESLCEALLSAYIEALKQAAEVEG